MHGQAPVSTLRASLGDVAVDSITVCLEAGRVVFVETRLPNVSASKRNALLRYAIEDKLSADPAAIHAVIVGKSSYQAGYSIVAAIDTRWFSAMLATLAACNLSAQKVIDLPQALRLIDTTNSTKNTAPRIGVNLQEGTGFAVRDDGYALSFEGATANNPPFALVLALQEFAQQRGAASESTAVFSIADALNGANGALDLAQWATATNQTLTDGGVLNLQLLAQMVVVAQIENRKPALPQLLTGAHAPASQLSGQTRLFKPAILLAAAAIIVHIGHLAWDNWRLTNARDAVQSQMVQLFQKVFPDAKAIVDPALQMQRSLNTLKGAATVSAVPPFALALVDAAAILDTQTGKAQVKSVSGTDKNIKIDATVTTAESANAVRSRATTMRPDATLTITAASDGNAQKIMLTLPIKNSVAQQGSTP